MRKPIIAGNWKMNKTPAEAVELVKGLIPLVKDAKCDVVVCVPATDFAAVKEAAGSVDRVSMLKDICDITVLSGDDSLALPMVSVGAAGVISVSSNIIPAEMSEMLDLALAGDFKGALKLHQKYYCLFRDQFVETNPIPIKAAMAMAGWMKEEYRLPLCELSAEHREKLIAAMKRVGDLK